MSNIPLTTLLDHWNDTVLDGLNKKELDEMQKLNDETISKLEAEINLLERKISQFGPDNLPRPGFQLVVRPDGTSNLEDLEASLDKEISTYSARLDETVRLTGITIESISRQVLELDDHLCKKRFSLDLLIINKRVHLDYNLEETLDTTGEQGGKVTWFKVTFEEDINEAVGADIAEAADSLEIHSVFCILKSFIQWQTERDDLMKRFVEKYPENISQQVSADGHLCLRITNTRPARPEFILKWARKLVKSRMDADIRVEVNAPTELLEMDKKKTLQAVPGMFATMVAKLGLMLAIDGLVQLAISDGQNVLEEPSAPAETPPADGLSQETPSGDGSSQETPQIETSMEQI